MFIDGNDDYYGTDGVQNIPVADAVLSILIDRNISGCSLQQYCQKSNLLNYDRNICSNAPWKQCKKEIPCPVAVYFKCYGVDKLNYKWRNSFLNYSKHIFHNIVLKSLLRKRIKLN